MAQVAVSGSFRMDLQSEKKSQHFTLVDRQTVRLTVQLSKAWGEGTAALYRVVTGAPVLVTAVSVQRGFGDSNSDISTTNSTTVAIDPGEYYVSIDGNSGWGLLEATLITGMVEYEAAPTGTSPAPGGTTPGGPITGGSTPTPPGGPMPGGPLPTVPGGSVGWWANLSTNEKVLVGGVAAALVAGGILLAAKTADSPRMSMDRGE